MPRLPIPGNDNGTWGDILNEYLSQTLEADGTLGQNTVTNYALVDNTIEETKLTADVRAKLNSTTGASSVTSVSSRTGDIVLTKSDVGLGSVDNTSDAVKNSAISTLSNKTIASPVLSGTVTGSYTLGGTPTFPSTIVSINTPQTLSSKTLTAPILNIGVSGSAILDEDDMVSNSATKLATQQSIKAYVDSSLGSGNVSSTLSITDHAIVRGDGGSKGVQGTGVSIDDSDNISGLGTVNSLTLPSSDFVGRTDAQILTNKTLDADNNTITNLAIGAEVTGASTDLTDTSVISYITDIDDIAVDGETSAPISSNWAYDHENSTTAHGATGASVGTTNTQTLTNKTLTSPILNTGVSGTAILDEDNMASDSATKLATQQSIKAYVDANASTGDMEASTYDPAGVSEQLVGLTATQTLTNKTLTTPKIAQILDGYDNILLDTQSYSSSVNYLQIGTGATGNSPWIQAAGSDTNLSLDLYSKGSGSVLLYSESGNRIFEAYQGSASAVNYLYAENAATGDAARLGTDGSDTDIDLDLVTKGAGIVKVNGIEIVTAPDDISKLVASTASGSSGTENGADTWAQIATFSTGTTQYTDCSLVLSVSSASTGNHDSAIISVFFRANSTGQTPDVDVDIIAKGGGGYLIDNDSFKVISDGWSSDMQLWMKKGDDYGGFNIYELSKRIGSGSTLTYNTNSNWQSAVPSGSINNVSSNGVTAFGERVVDVTSTQTLSNKTLESPLIKDSNGNTIFDTYSGAGAVNYLRIENGATGYGANIKTDGSDSDVSMSLYSKGSGSLNVFSGDGNYMFQTRQQSASAVNYIYTMGTDTGNGAVVGASGTDTNVYLNLLTKGTGVVQANGTEVTTISGTQTLTNKTLSYPNLSDSILDSNDNPLISNDSWSSSAVNYLGIETSPSGDGYIQLNANGSDTNINLTLKPKGTGHVTMFAGSNSTANFSANGSSSDVNLNLVTKGTGVVQANGVKVATASDIPVLNTQSGTLLYGTTLDLHPESSGFNTLPHIVNDIAYNSQRGGSVSYTLNAAPATPTGNENPFLPDATTAQSFSLANAATDVVVVEVTNHRTFNWGATIGIVMTPWCTAKDVVIEIYDPIATTWISLYSATDEESGHHWAGAYDSGSYDGANGFSKIRFTLSNFITTGNFRITQMYVVGYDSSLASGTFLPRGGGSLYGTSGASPELKAAGSDSDIGLVLYPKGAGSVTIYADSGQTPTLHAGGADTNHDLNLITQGTGVVKAGGNPIISSVTGIPAVTGAPSSSTYLRGDGTWSAPSGGVSGMLEPVQAVALGSETFTIVSGTVSQIAGTTVNGGYAPAIGDRILIINAPASTGVGSSYTTTAQPANGIYTVTDNITNLSLSRSSDMSGSVNPTGLFVWSQGTSGWSDQTLWHILDPSSGNAAFTWGATDIQFRPVFGGNGNTNIYTLNTTNLYIQGSSYNAKIIQNSSSAAPQNLTLPAPTTDTIVSRTSTDVLTNKSITARVGSTTSSATPSINTDDYDQYNITALATDITSLSSNLSGTPSDGQSILIRIKDNGTARAITWGASWRAIGVTLPTTTVINKTMYIGARYNVTDSKWDVLTVNLES